MFTTPLGNEYIVSSSFKDIAIKMYQDQEAEKKKDVEVEMDVELEDKPAIPVDFKPEPPCDPEGNKIAY